MSTKTPKNEFCVFILTHGRPNKVVTYNSLIKHGYTGDVYIIIDNEDKTEAEYKKVFGNKVIVFDKKKVSETFDEGDNFGDRRTIIYARNACFQIAKDLGYKYFMELDDDYNCFMYRYDENLEFKSQNIYSLDVILKLLLDYYKKTPFKSIAIAQGGDFIGGDNGFAESILRRRKCMNSFICSTDRPFQFVGRINEDVNTYTHLGSIGYLFLTIPYIMLIQLQTQSNQGGTTDVYLDSGTYIKSFYSVMYQPSSVRIGTISDSFTRLHHKISWKHTVPMIINEKYGNHKT